MSDKATTMGFYTNIVATTKFNAFYQMVNCDHIVQKP